eukprot:gnl/MRDRNA2_/MRDRNA2_138421_c0_seq1.p1 gnl/MRDRNA2_/MRDRNA2_138421_c0~~gnl/MRDRNA2_/MRDRNA2_138421_c0_seq1.p1  ORF type:complete len:294 (-),score=59.09 gnl/MRDRNA2_/MRDRNA2_138421_c0_seq1:44-925(-)
MDFDTSMSAKVFELANELCNEEMKIKKAESEVRRMRRHLIRSVQSVMQRWIGNHGSSLLSEFLLAWRRIVGLISIERRAEELTERLQSEKVRIDEETQSLRAQLQETRKSADAMEDALVNERHLVEGLAKEAAAHQEQGDCIMDQLQDAERLMLRLQGHFQIGMEQDFVGTASTLNSLTPPRLNSFAQGNSLEVQALQLPPATAPPTLQPPHVGMRGAGVEMNQNLSFRDTSEQGEALMHTVGSQVQSGGQAQAPTQTGGPQVYRGGQAQTEDSLVSTRPQGFSYEVQHIQRK